MDEAKSVALRIEMLKLLFQYRPALDPTEISDLADNLVCFVLSGGMEEEALRREQEREARKKQAA